MGEVAFRVKKGSDFYKKYCIAEAERRKFHKLALEFFKKYGFCGKGGYYQSKTLCMELTPEERDRFAVQIKKRSTRNGLSEFKKNSVMQKDWESSVCSQIDFNKLNSMVFWYLQFNRHGGRHALWYQDGEIYGLLESQYENYENLPDWMERISLSKYYAIRDGE